ncbi:MAG: ATP-binding protein [Lachnospiraceae bacterium]|nr:ATP-binding protein [Lachnospiraceae bacterium]
MGEILIDAKRENLRKVFDFVNSEVCESVDDKSFLRQLKLCVEEAYLNIAEHAYTPETGSVRILAEVRRDAEGIKVILSFSDRGRPYDPLKTDLPDVGAGIGSREPGGLGILLIKHTADGVDYEYKNGENVLTIEKRYTA